MNRSSNSHSRMFLMEMMFAILFFSLAGAVCLRMFAASRRMSVSAAELNMAVNQAGNAAELLKNSYRTNASRFPGCILDEYPDAAADGAGITVYYDTNWESCPKETGAYYMQILQTAVQDDITPFQILVYDAAEDEASIYSLELKLHAPNQP